MKRHTNPERHRREAEKAAELAVKPLIITPPLSQYHYTPPAEETPEEREARIKMIQDFIDKQKHVYDWLDEISTDPGEIEAKEWLEQFCKPAIEKDHDYLNRYKVTAVYYGRRFHVSGASRMGDVWLRDPGSKNFYDRRVNVDELSEWQRVELKS